MRLAFLVGFVLAFGPLTAAAGNKSTFLDLARQGWSYELRAGVTGDADAPAQINGQRFSGANLCVIGERPHPASRATLDAFRNLMARVFGRPLLLRYAGADAAGCGTGRVVVLRLYSGHPPNRALSEDLNWMNDVYALGLPDGRAYAATSPAMAQTLFGRRGQGTHIMVQQPAFAALGPLEEAFFRSILIEELYQAFTFGVDVLLFDRKQPFLSKLQETPLNLSRLAWNSRAFMTALLKSNPRALCEFDVFMLHAVAQSPAEQTNAPEFIEFIEAEFDALAAMTGETLDDPRLAGILDPDCAERAG